MGFRERFTTTERKAEVENNVRSTQADKDREATKTIISNDAYAIGDILQEMLGEFRKK